MTRKTWPCWCSNSAAPRSPTSTASATSPRHVKREVEAGHACRRRGLGHGRHRPTSSSPGCGAEASHRRLAYDAREYDAVVASGEQVTSGLLAIVLQSIGIQARSWQGWQIPIKTDGAHRRGAHHRTSTARLIKDRMARAQVAVIAGFQGIAPGQPHLDARARRLRHQRGGDRRRARGRPLRHLYRCRRRLHDRSAHRAEGAAARPNSPSRRCWKWPRSAPRCCRCARSSSPWCTGCACLCARASTPPTLRNGADGPIRWNAHLRRG